MLVYTQSAQTVQAQLTSMAANKPTATTPAPTATVVTPTPESVTPTQNTPTSSTPNATQSSGCVNKADYVDDITYPDNAEVAKGEEFIKTWKLINSGTCSWTGSYMVVFSSGDDLGAPKEVPVTAGIDVPAGAIINVSVPLKAPAINGTYTAYFKLKAADGTIFGINYDAKGSFYVKINVVDSPSSTSKTATPTGVTVPTATP